MATSTMQLRRLATLADFEACVALQRETWGADFSGCVPAAVLMVVHKVGGVVAGAFDEDGQLIGFVFGITGNVNGHLLHWSHMLAVRERARDAGLGVRLKLFQRELLIESGVDVARWTFDPLVAKNAHININRLGAAVVEYVETMYGDSNSTLHAGLGTDRLVVEWRLSDEHVGPDATAFATAPIVGERSDPVRAPRVRIEIPVDIHAVLNRARQEAVDWSARTRRAFLRCLGRGYRVAAFYREQGRCYYGLTNR
jgi:chorismate synthase